ncbi:MAG: ABC transporter ATP-binding protein [Gammaproteobacteria bacterium]|nr:ABC transporter ATP-binding protein [Gammaproteobacteria bacterium]
MSNALIRTVDLSRNYQLGGEAVYALQGVGLEIDRGEFVAIMGPSGSGKSTLMNLLGFLDRPSAGHYYFEGEDVTGIGADARAAIRSRKIGFVFQNFNLLRRSTALENVELPLIYSGKNRAERIRRAQNALAAVELGHRKAHWPHQLSGGEQQRVAVARAIVNGPALILADEPTGSLDSRTGLEILALFQILHRSGHAVLLVTHDRNVASHAGRIVTLRDGRVVTDEPVAAPFDAWATLADLPGPGKTRETATESAP